MLLIVCRLKVVITIKLTLKRDALDHMAARQLRQPSKRITNTLANNVVSFRKALALSQEQLADRCGLHRTYIGSVERGERNVTLSSLEALASALDVTVTQLLTEATATHD